MGNQRMTIGDAIRLLSIAATFDKRTIGEFDGRAWADALHDLDPQDCSEAIRVHARTSDAWLMPVHIRVIVKAIKAQRAEERHQAEVMRMIEAPRPNPAEHHANYRAAVEALPEKCRTSSLPEEALRIRAVKCPFCGANPGDVCTRAGKPLDAVSHPMRAEAAGVTWTPSLPADRPERRAS